MSVNLQNYRDFSDWSNQWKNLLNFIIDIEKINHSEGFETKIDQIIREYDPLLWGSYRKGDMSNISYENHTFQLAYLLRYFALYSSTIECIDSRNNFLDEIFISDAVNGPEKNSQEKFYISIFGGGSAPEALSLIRSLTNRVWINKIWTKDLHLSNIGLYFSIFDKHTWNTGRKFIKNMISKEVSLFCNSLNLEKSENFIKTFFNERKMNIKDEESLSYKNYQDLIIFQFSLTEFRDLIGHEELTKKIHQISKNLSPNGKLIFIERDHSSTPWDFFESFEQSTNLNLQTYEHLVHEAQAYREIPKFISQIYRRVSRNISRINRFMFKIYGYQKKDDSIILKDETTEPF